MITQERLKEIFDYNPETGVFIRIAKTSNCVKVGDVSGCDRGDGYLQITVDRNPYYAHRLAILYVDGDFPTEQVDHINHIPSDNRYLNLRPVSHKNNHRNVSKQKNNTSGVTGVTWDKRSMKWVAQIHVDGSHIYLGSFIKISDAKLAKKLADIQYDFHGNHGS